MSQECLPFDAWPTLGETRLTTIIHEEKIHRHTVINEWPIVPFESSLDLIHSIEKQLKPDDFLILSGSLPRGVRRFVFSFNSYCASKKLIQCLIALVYLFFGSEVNSILVKPNVKEAEEALGLLFYHWVIK